MAERVLRKPLKITGRTSVVTNGFVQAILPFVMPSEAEIEAALNFLGQSAARIECVYCGDPASDWDHLRPLVRNKRPTGFVSDIGNMVPACGRCNQSKSGADWKDWMLGPAKNAPKAREVARLADRVALIEAYIDAFPVERMDFEGIAGPEEWAAYWARLDEIHAALHEAQIDADRIKANLQSELVNRRKRNGADVADAPRRVGK